MANILILNGPNLNMLGARETDIYGTTTLSDIEAMCHEHARAVAGTAERAGNKSAKTLSLELTFRQSNSESELIEWVQGAGKGFAGVIINAGGFSHTSVALMDALLTLKVPVVEVHLSNIYRREEFRHHSYVSHAANGVICGFGPASYTLALEAMAGLLAKQR